MTVSHTWFNLQVHDCSINFQNIALGLNNKLELGYDITNPEFKELVKCVTLGTTAKFDFKPDSDMIKRRVAKLLRKKVNSVKKHEIEEHQDEVIKLLHEEEDTKPLQKKKVLGDASESGLIKFAAGVNNLEEERKKNPIHPYESVDEDGKRVTGQCEIPFNSTNKYNMLIRDCNPEEKSNEKRSIILLMKGAPERIYGRCSHILINGEEVQISKAHDDAFEKANKIFGGQGERVLAFARSYLDPNKYPKDYKFNMEKDKYNFPMEGLCLVGLVSLNDPPKRFVAHSVTKCRKAGIKVIMVTGDQPVTAAAIAK